MALPCWLLIWPSTEQSFGSVTGAWRSLVNRADFELKPTTSQSGFFCAPKGLACFSAQRARDHAPPARVETFRARPHRRIDRSTFTGIFSRDDPSTFEPAVPEALAQFERAWATASRAAPTTRARRAACSRKPVAATGPPGRPKARRTGLHIARGLGTGSDTSPRVPACPGFSRLRMRAGPIETRGRTPGGPVPSPGGASPVRRTQSRKGSYLPGVATRWRLLQ